MVAVPTVRIVHPDFPEGIVINEEDFDAKNHVRFEDAERPRRGRPPASAKAEN